MMKRIHTLLVVAFLATGAAAQPISLSFSNFSLESGTDLQPGAVYRFTAVATGVDALVEVVALANGATLTQIDDASPISAPFQPQMSAMPSNSGRVDFAITLVAAGTSTPGAVTGLEISAIDVDGAAGRQEFVDLSGAQSYTVEGTPPSELTISNNVRGIHILSPETTYGGIDPNITQVIAVADIGSTSRIELSIGQTGTATTAGNRLFSLDFTVSAVTFTNPITTNLNAVIGTALAVGAIVDNLDGTYTIPMTVTLEGFADVSLFDLQVTNDLATSFGTFVSTGPLVPDQYMVDDPQIGTLTGGAVLTAGNASFDGSSDTNLLTLTSGDKLPVGATATVTFNVTWFPAIGVTSTTNQATGRGDYAENGTSDADASDLSHAGNDPDPEPDGDPTNNSTVTAIDLGILPVELGEVQAIPDGRTVSIRWTTYSENGNSGFDVEHRGPLNDMFRSVGFISGAGTTTEERSYAYEFVDLEPGLHAFRLRQNDIDGGHRYSEVLTVEVEMAESFELGEAYPNPFNPSTAIRFSLREAGEASLSVFDVTGRMVRALASGSFEAGTHEFVFHADDLPSGLYVYRLVTRAGTVSAPVVLLK